MERVELDADALIRTAKTLEGRIARRFPEASLAAQAGFLVSLAERSKSKSIQISRPIWWIRALYITLCLLVVVGLIAIPRSISISPSQDRDFLDYIEIIEAGINEVVLLGAGIAFLVTAEGRYKRTRTLKELHQIRSFAHVIDMHQLAKDPQQMLGLSDAEGMVGEQKMTPKNLGRYLDYCSELLAISSKVAAMYVQRFDDSITLDAVTEIETLTSGLSRKVWQKLTVLIEIYPGSMHAEPTIYLPTGSPRRPGSVDARPLQAHPQAP